MGASIQLKKFLKKFQKVVDNIQFKLYTIDVS